MYCQYILNIHGSQRMNPTDFGGPLTFHLDPPSGQSPKVYDQIASLTLPSASAPLCV